MAHQSLYRRYRPRRFSELHRGIDGITARMLTVTLRGLERDGILTRTVQAAVPPRVDYALTLRMIASYSELSRALSREVADG